MTKSFAGSPEFRASADLAGAVRGALSAGRALAYFRRDTKAIGRECTAPAVANYPAYDQMFANRRRARPGQKLQLLSKTSPDRDERHGRLGGSMGAALGSGQTAAPASSAATLGEIQSLTVTGPIGGPAIRPPQVAAPPGRLNLI